MKRKRESIRIWVIGRKLWITTGCLILVVAMFWVVNIPTAVRVSSTTRELPIYSVQRDQKMVAISFDAAWADVSLRTWERFCSHVRISFFRASHPAWMFQQRFALCVSSLRYNKNRRWETNGPVQAMQYGHDKQKHVLFKKNHITNQLPRLIVNSIFSEPTK